MTSRKDEIHKLIADIDNLLANSGNPLSKLLSGQGQEERDVLQRVREFLVKLNESETPEETPVEQSQTQPLSSLLARYVEQEHNQAGSKSYQSQQPQANFTAEQLKDEISVVLQPLQAELSSLLQERASLVQEIRQLEQKRLQNYSLTQQLATQEQIISEFLQVLISRLVPNLIPYLTRNAANSSSLTTGETKQEVSNSAIQPVVESVEGLERLASLAKELDQRLLSLDGTVNVIFEALERNINTYYQSLSQALARMHSQGLQGEQLMANFLNNLHQTLQIQSPDAPPLTFGLDSATEVQPVSSVAEELIQDTVTADTQEPEIVENLEAVLSQLTAQPAPVSAVDSFISSNISSDETPSENGEELIQDTVTADTQEPEIVENLEAVLSQLTAQPAPVSAVDSFISSNISSDETPSENGEELIQDTVTADIQEPEIVENLEAVLLQLRSDEISSSVAASFTTPDETQSESIDEVDELYASLFGGADRIKSTESTTESTAVPVVTSEVDNTAEISESMSASLIIPEAQEEAQELNVQVSSESVEQEDLNIFEQSNNFPPENAAMVVETTEPASSDLWEKSLLPEDTQSQAEFASTPTLLNFHPDSSDTITVLTDLLVDVFGEEQVTEALAVDDHPDTTELETPIVSSAVEESTETQNLASAYILASPQENLLSIDNTDTETQGIPNIVLDEAQLQQLDRDLTNFDWRLNSESQQTTNVESLQDSVSEGQNILQDILDTGMQLMESPSSTATENIPLAAVSNVNSPQSPQTEKKKEVTNSSPEVALLGDNKLSDNSVLRVNDPNFVWYLGIDLGTTGISAALLNRSQLVVYPIYWSTENPSGNTAFEQSFRLPAEVYLPTASIPHSDAESRENRENREQTTPAAVAQDQTHSTTAPKQNLYSAHLKPFLDIGIPYRTTQQKWEPVLQLNEFSAGPLIWVVRSLSKLLLTLKSDQTSTTPALIAHAVGIDPQVFSAIMNNITGVVCSCPSSWSEQYRFNVREAILASQLVSHPQEIFFVEEAIASLLPELNPSNSPSVQLHDNQGLRPLKTSENFHGGTTLALNIGATATEMALVDLPADLSQLTYRDFMLHSFAYAGKAMEQDIICQLLLPPKSRQPRGRSKANSSISSSNPWHWQPSIPGLDQIQWSSLSLEALELPRVGEPDLLSRIRFQQKLESSLLGQGLLDAALALKLILQHQESFTLELADQCWILQRRDLETQVFVPYIRRLNRELNKLLVARGIPTEAVDQTIISGGVAAIATVNRWLRQKLPNAKIIQDLYLGENGAPKCSRVAYGLATLPLHPQVLEVPKQQYTDYFLFSELLKILPHSSGGETMRSLSFGEILQLFENRGINTRICQQRLLAFLEGELPAGLIPTAAEILPEPDDKLLSGQTSLNSLWLAKTSQENPDYQAIASAPLFQKQGNLTYRPNSQQLLLLRRYLDAIKASSLQSLEEPLAVNLISTVSQ
ncbi:hypothetical protein IQ227_14200 [Anabaena aphanizomenioides LEGE 00250]|uniref:Uncharacterized protein n=1 Tax=Sphaerospermopsis aphanizomenoides LEGE 00250 TaxID=2777972 RepID=A0ABR9VGA7_9CYAN|nr:hypothetical protein [Sphaerospermopsis aphanizomenoides]MBE9237147.1 hypothetical protein [Sphaerospermopsis aphanizomenoides LEGE 00250]